MLARGRSHAVRIKADTVGTVVGMTADRGFARSPEGGRRLPAAGGNLLAGVEDTNGMFTLIHTRVPPGDEVPLHRHGEMDESLYVLRGGLSVTCGDDRCDVAAGHFVHLPRGIPHGYTTGPDGAEFLIHGAPAGLEAFFDDWEGGMTIDEAAAAHGIQFVGE